MNKLLLLALIVLLGVLAFSMGLFSKDQSTTLSQYVPDSVGRLFSNNSTNESAEAALKAEKLSSVSSPNLAMPDYSKNNTDSSSSESSLKNEDINNQGVDGISDSLIQELQQQLSPEITLKSLKRIESALQLAETENKALKSKYDSLTAEFNDRSGVLKEIENQIKNINN